MIEINLIHGARKSKRGRGSSMDLRGMFGDLSSRFRDPWLISAIVGAALGVGSVGYMSWRTSARAAVLTANEQQAVQDSTRYASVIYERMVAEAQRDSVIRQIAIIRSIDGSRFSWTHLLDEINKALTPYTWITSLQQTSAVPAVTPEVEAGVSKASPKPSAEAKAQADEAAVTGVVTVRLVGQTVDIQALTRFVRQLEDSPWLENVTLSRTEDVLAQPSNKEVKEFTLDMRIHHPDSTSFAGYR